jgi:Stress responsive A/B Barrel Domain
MIRHCVFVKFSSDVGDDERQSIFAALDALRGVVDGIEAAHFGRNVSPEGLGKGFDDGFTIDFRDAAARDTYLVHPAHRQAGARLVAALQGGVDGLVVFDLELA